MDVSDRIPQFCTQSTIERIRARIGSDVQCKRFAFIIMSASFNPIHVDHARMMDMSRRHAESLGWNIVAGFLAPSSDEYVKGKCSKGALSLQQRIVLCEVAIKNSEWLAVFSEGELSSNRIRRQIGLELEVSLANVLNGRQLIGMEIMGSDTVLRIFTKILANPDVASKQTQRGRIVLWFLRAGLHRATQREQIETLIAPEAEKLGVSLIAVELDLWGPPLKGISSEKVRELALNVHWEALSSNGWLAQAVSDSLKDALHY